MKEDNGLDSEKNLGVSQQTEFQFESEEVRVHVDRLGPTFVKLQAAAFEILLERPAAQKGRLRVAS